MGKNISSQNLSIHESLVFDLRKSVFALDLLLESHSVSPWSDHPDELFGLMCDHVDALKECCALIAKWEDHVRSEKDFAFPS